MSSRSGSASRPAIDQPRGVALGAVNIPLRNTTFRAEMERRLELPISMENDGSSAAYAEFLLGAGRGVRDIVMLTLGTGVGGGVVADGAPLSGLDRARAHGDRRGRRAVPGCVPGARAPRGVLLGPCRRQARAARAGPNATAHDLVAERHPALEEVGHHLGVAIGSLVNIFGPERVVIGGGFGVAAFELLMPAARLAVSPRRSLPPGRRSQIELAELGADAGLIGAGLLAFEALSLVPLAVCATPIGNLEDITLRVLAELREADVVLAEDTRHTRGLLERHGIRARLLSYHEHNEAARVAELLPRLAAGERIALVTDAGMPAISDPGARLVRAALDAGVAVTVLPGASAVETALVASGLAGAGYAFVGFLPRARRARSTRSGASSRRGRARSSRSSRRSGSPRRCARSRRSTPTREVAVCRELTKRFEEVVRGTAARAGGRASRRRRRARSRS